MERLRGIVGKVASTAIEYPGRSKYAQKRTVHSSMFQIDGQLVKYESNRRMRQTFNEGDDVIVAGTARRGTFVALAYRNFTTGNAGSDGWFLKFFCGVVFLGVGIAILGLIDGRLKTIGIIGVGIFGGVFCAFSALLFFVGARTLQALNELRKEVP